MHIEKNVSENLIATLLNLYPKTKDGLDARLDLVKLDVGKNFIQWKMMTEIKLYLMHLLQCLEKTFAMYV